jgi:hypothetical protein
MSSSNSTTNAPLENSITLEGLLHMQSVTNQLIGTSCRPEITPCSLNITRSGLFSVYRMGA